MKRAVYNSIDTNLILAKLKISLMISKGVLTMFLKLGIFLILLGYVKFCIALVMQYGRQKES